MKMPNDKPKYNPVSSRKIGFDIKLGWNGTAMFPGLERLSGQSAVFDVRMTWLDAFKAHFGISLNPIKYSVQRLWKDTGRLKHDLREPIKLMMQDWAKIQRSFKIYIVLNNKSVQVSRIEDSGKYPMRTGPTELLTLDDDDMMSPPSVVGIQMRNQFYNSEVAKNNGRTSSINMMASNEVNFRNGSSPTPTYNNQARQSALVHRNVSGEHSSSSFVSQTRYTSSSHVPPLTIRMRPPPPRTQPVPASYQAPTSTVLSKISKPKATQPVCYTDSDDDSDARSDVTNDSQDSQLEDLQALGIPYEDLKSMVVSRAKKNYTNIQFLKLKHELQQFRKKNERRWIKWTTSAPITANILRELFEIDEN
ncbi:uncharacterized protein LOC110847344 [Folsomia candida]|uniref:Uncharacterized protein n=1 Tax=Folsomia candida TaxID=158441 RepID=A0A226F0A3_FOLCA|nr:uncharacterized protein LOC110847344 [Folsomia candida]XP_035702328.1 uncharacterized protein LOC110847344 [Folsomia candida]OXA62356.1 hypothetical protein Fcan01_01018 [Folsomia candida]